MGIGEKLSHVHGRCAPPAANRDGHALDHVDAEALDADDAALVVRHETDLGEAEVGEYLRAETEVAERLARLIGTLRARAAPPCHQLLEALGQARAPARVRV